MRVAVIALVFASASAACAEDAVTFYSNEGDAYVGILNENGAVLTSQYPKSWFHGEPWQDLQVHTKPAILYLGNDCDALHNEYGAGRWSGSNGGFGAQFGEQVFERGSSIRAPIERRDGDGPEAFLRAAQLAGHIHRRQAKFIEVGWVGDEGERAQITLRAQAHRPPIGTAQVARKQKVFARKQRGFILGMGEGFPAEGV